MINGPGIDWVLTGEHRRVSCNREFLVGWVRAETGRGRCIERIT